ncbi:YiaA/YiaB family inner membrane protein [Niabella hirudinis]|uniref:YiaA/YiaB family inner membrane protein n=1 Tax=Niabella hirudinis TaxID=1285929 RepID=UPI003EC0181A
MGLRNASLTKSEKEFYAMSFALGIFAAIAVQKNTRDSRPVADEYKNNHPGTIPDTLE